jgi:UDP-glucose 4-epimerase
MNIIVTGGAGYIGSHTVLELLQNGHSVTVIDNLSNSKLESLNRVKKITKKTFDFKELDLRDTEKLEPIFKNNAFDCVIHFAGLKAVGESVLKAREYYDNNLGSTLSLLKAMDKYNCRKLVFSSSATVYGNPETVPIRENAPLNATNPYGQTKLMIEQLLMDISKSEKLWNIISLRYFNPIGAHESGLIGEDPNGIPNNLMPYITQVASGKLQKLSVYGNDYETADGTGVRDYIHVTDLANAHLAAITNINNLSEYRAYNIGTGRGVSVKEAINAFERVSGKKIPYKIVERRAGDVATCFANPKLANKELGWEAKKTFEDACQDAWRWQSKNPNGY